MYCLRTEKSYWNHIKNNWIFIQRLLLLCSHTTQDSNNRHYYIIILRSLLILSHTFYGIFKTVRYGLLLKCCYFMKSYGLIFEISIQLFATVSFLITQTYHPSTVVNIWPKCFLAKNYLYDYFRVWATCMLTTRFGLWAYRSLVKWVQDSYESQGVYERRHLGTK